MNKENQNVEWKISWRDEYLKWISGFAKTFFRAGYIEIWGRGTVNIIEYCKHADVPEPVFEDKWGGLAVIFVNEDSARPWEDSTDERLGKKLTKNQDLILKLIKDNPYISIVDISKSINISTTAIENNIAKLKKKELLIRKGSANGGYWKLMDEK